MENKNDRVLVTDLPPLLGLLARHFEESVALQNGQYSHLLASFAFRHLSFDALRAGV